MTGGAKTDSSAEHTASSISMETGHLNERIDDSGCCIVALLFGGCTLFVLSYVREDSGKDCLIRSLRNHVASFSSGVALMEYVSESGLALYPTCSDYETHNRIEHNFLRPAMSADGYVDCRLALDRWNFCSDVAYSVGAPFLGDADDYYGLVNDVYCKLFAGNNFPTMVEEGRLYRPEWSPSELMLIAAVLDDGTRLLKDALGVEVVVPSERGALKDALRYEQLRCDCALAELPCELQGVPGARAEAICAADCESGRLLPGPQEASSRILNLWRVAYAASCSAGIFFAGALIDEPMRIYLHRLERESRGEVVQGGQDEWTAADRAVLATIVDSALDVVGEASS